MFKIGLKNRNFCKSLHFYKVDAGKKKEKEKKRKRAASAGLFCCSRPFVSIQLYTETRKPVVTGRKLIVFFVIKFKSRQKISYTTEDTAD